MFIGILSQFLILKAPTELPYHAISEILYRDEKRLLPFLVPDFIYHFFTKGQSVAWVAHG
jgi:hypothetical protein